MKQEPKQEPKKIKELYCDFCDRTGIIHERHFEQLGRVPLSPCPKCVVPKCKCGGEDPYFYYEDTIKNCFCREIRMKIDKINKIYTQSGIDKKFRWKLLGDYEGRNKLTNEAKNAAYDIVTKFPNVRKGLFLWGNPGTGKTLLSSIILTELIKRHAIQGRFIKISRTFFGRLKASFVEGSNNYGEANMIEKEMAEVDILIIDDFGIQRDSPWEQETLYNLVDARYEAEKFTIFTSNNNPVKAFQELSQGRILSRIKEMCRIMEISGDDYRDTL
ncbi:MAG: ATP-binding protein [bacterium]|nr:ATP-binding protein [bacterium]